MFELDIHFKAGFDSESMNQEDRMADLKAIIESGKTALGIEFGSTRIKAVLIDESFKPIASGSYSWENQLIDGFWTYSLDDIWKG